MDQFGATWFVLHIEDIVKYCNSLLGISMSILSFSNPLILYMIHRDSEAYSSVILVPKLGKQYSE